MNEFPREAAAPSASVGEWSELTTIAPEGFGPYARAQGWTPESFASFVLKEFMLNAPEEPIIIESGTPMNEQECGKCPIKSKCKSSACRHVLACFERIVILPWALFSAACAAIGAY